MEVAQGDDNPLNFPYARICALRTLFLFFFYNLVLYRKVIVVCVSFPQKADKSRPEMVYRLEKDLSPLYALRGGVVNRARRGE